MNIDAAFLPGELEDQGLSDRAVVVFDVLRATTSIAAALDAGVREIHIFTDVFSARSAGASGAFSRDRLLCGEVDALAPPGFDLGNSPRAFNRAEHADRTMLLATTNGTRALLAAAGAGTLLCGALVNAAAVADALITVGKNVLLLGAGTQGAVAMEDVIGAGAVIDELQRRSNAAYLISDCALIAHKLFRHCQADLPGALRQTAGGKNVIAAGLEGDIDFAARMNSISAVGHVQGRPPVIRPYLSQQSA